MYQLFAETMADGMFSLQTDVFTILTDLLKKSLPTFQINGLQCFTFLVFDP